MDGASRLHEAQEALAAGRLPEAAGAFETLLPDLANRAEDEAAALHGLALAYGRQGRFFEAAVTARRLVRHQRRRMDRPGLRAALAILVGALINSTAHERALPHLDELEPLLEGLAPLAEPNVRRMLHNARYSLALLQGDFAEARRRLAEIRTLIEAGALPEEEWWYLRNAEFHLAAHEHDIPRMESILEHVLGTPASENVYVPEVTVRLGLAGAYAGAGRLDEARAMGAQVLAFLRENEGGGDLVIGDGVDVVRLFADLLGQPEAGQELARLVSARLLERIRCLRESADTLRSLVDESDETFITEMEDDFHTSLVRFLRSSGSRLDVATTGDEVDREGVTVCAWCGAVRILGANWVPLRTFVRELPVLSVSHGMCPPCLDRELTHGLGEAP